MPAASGAGPSAGHLSIFRGQDLCHGALGSSQLPFWANQFRLFLHSAAYWLLDTLRRWLARCHVPHLQLSTLRLRLLKIGGWVRQRLDVVRLHLASSHPGEPLWHLLAARPHRL